MYRIDLAKAIQYASETGGFNNMNRVKNARNVCVFGLGTYFNEAFASQHTKELYHVNLLSDNDPDKWGKIYEGIECVPPNELKNYDDLLVIIMLGNPTSVEKQLKDMNIPYVYHVNLSLDRIMNLNTDSKWFENEIPDIQNIYDLFEDEVSQKVYVGGLVNRIANSMSRYTWEQLYSDEPQYFSQNEIKFDNNEVYVDCGAYIGDTIIEFAETVHNKYKKIFAFELDSENYSKMKKNLADYSDVICYNYGVWSKTKELEYGIGSSNNEPDAGKSIYKTEDSENNIVQKAKVVSLDEILKNEEITFIKMDVEGAEIDALKGAANIISNQKPKLAISVYHKTSDFWQIPKLIKEFNPKYKFMLRHYTKTNLLETVLYAY